MTLSLRAFEPADDAALISWLPDADAVFRWTGPMLDFPLDSAQLARVRDLPDTTEWTALDESGERIGHIGLVRTAPGSARIARVIVAPVRRGTGLGRELMRAAIDRGRELGLAALTLNVVAENATAIGLYSSLSFADTGMHPDWDGMRTMELEL